jgi:hypothetical protein
VLGFDEPLLPLPLDLPPLLPPLDFPLLPLPDFGVLPLPPPLVLE